MTDPYSLGFYVGLATATVIEVASILAVGFLIRAKRARPKPFKRCETCEAELAESGYSRDALFNLFVCPDCGDTVPKRFAREGFVPVAEVVTPMSQ